MVGARRKRSGRVCRGRLMAVVLCVTAVVLSLVTVVNRLDAATSPAFTPLGEPGVGGRVTSISVSPHDPLRVLVGGDMLGAALSTDGGDSWTPSTGLPSYEMADFTWNPNNTNEVWAGSMSGPVLSTDGGARFNPVRGGAMGGLSGYPYSSPVQRIVYLNNDTVLAFGGSQRRWSEENGHPERYGRVWVATRASGWSWTLQATLPGNIVTASRVDTTIWALVRGGTAPGVYRSTDSGSTWNRTVLAPGGSHDELSDLAVHPSNPSIVWVTRAARTSGNSVLSGAVYRSDDGGGSWTALNLPTTGVGNVDQVTSFEAIEVGMSAGQPVLYTSDVGQFVKKTYRSLDGGANWATILDNSILDNSIIGNLPVAYSGGGDMFTLAVDPGNANSLYAGSQEHLLSYDGVANTWTDRASRWNIATGTWQGNGFSGLVASRVVFGPDNSLSLNALDGGNLLQSADSGDTWSRPLANNIRASADDWMDQWMGAVDTAYSANGQNVYVLKGMFGWFAGVAISTNRGQSFTLNEGSNGLPVGMTFTDRKVTAIEVLRRPGSTQDEVIFTMDGCIWRTTNGGGNWAKENRSCSLGLGDIVKDPITNGTIYVQGKTAVYRSTDYGKNFSAMAMRRGISPGATAGSQGRLAIANTGLAGGLYATSMDGTRKGVFKWNGTAWVDVTPAAPTQEEHDRMFDIAVDPTNPSRVAVVVLDHPYHDKTFATGVWISTNATATPPSWGVRSAGLGVLRGSAVAWDPMASGRLVVGTYGQGFYETLVP